VGRFFFNPDVLDAMDVSSLAGDEAVLISTIGVSLSTFLRRVPTQVHFFIVS